VDFKLFGGILGAIANGISIIILNGIWTNLAVRLTGWENHRTFNAYNDALIWKIFVFQFVNSYTSLYYIAFFKEDSRLFGVEHDYCKYQYRNDRLLGAGCIDELTIQLLTLLCINMFVGQAREVALPYVMSKINILLLKRKSSEGSKTVLPQWETEGKLSAFPGTFDEYTEMIIQYGYITLFAIAFPLAPVLAVLNNVVEIRTDAFKLLTSYTRPNYKSAKDIGNWFAILEIIGIIAVVTNSLLVGLSLRNVYDALDENGFAVLGVSMLLEHALLLGKYLISIMVPDVPGDVAKALARQEYIKNQLFKKLKGTTKTKVWELSDDEGEDEFSDDDEMKKSDK